jgi:hypothetical protein
MGFGIELDEKIYVAIDLGVATGNGAKQRQVTNAGARSSASCARRVEITCSAISVVVVVLIGALLLRAAM